MKTMKRKLRLQKRNCCCGAIKTIPCVCMYLGKSCSASKPKCPCFKLLHRQTLKRKRKYLSLS